MLGIGILCWPPVPATARPGEVTEKVPEEENREEAYEHEEDDEYRQQHWKGT